MRTRIELDPDGRRAAAVETYADPGTPEEYVIRTGIHTREAVAAAMRRPTKGPALIAALIVAGAETTRVGSRGFDRLLVALPVEPELRAVDLRAMAHALTGAAFGSWETIGAVCAHHLADAETVVDALWNAPLRITRGVAAAGGRLLPGAVDWVGRELERGEISGVRLARPDVFQRGRIAATIRRWETGSAGSAGLRSFVATNSFTFTREDDLFAAGARLAGA